MIERVCMVKGCEAQDDAVEQKWAIGGLLICGPHWDELHELITDVFEEGFEAGLEEARERI